MKPTINDPEPLVSPYAGADLFDCSKLTSVPMEYRAEGWMLLQPCTKTTLVGWPFWTLVQRVYMAGMLGYSRVIPHDSSPCYDLGSSRPVVRSRANYVVLMAGDPAWKAENFHLMTPEMMVAWMDKQGVPRAVLPDQDQ